jgi:Tfp pilus assembly protein PilN
VLLDAGSATLSYLDGGRVLMSRTASLAAASAGSERDVQALALEVRRTLVAGAAASRSGASGSAESQVWLAGHGADESLVEALAEALAPGGGAASRVALLQRDGIEGAETLPRSLDLALGLALMGMRAPGSSPWDGVNLAQRARVSVDATAPHKHHRVPWLAGVGAAAVGIALLYFAGPTAKDLILARAASRAQTEAKQLATRRSEMQDSVQKLAAAITPEHSYLDVLNEVSTLVGSQIWLMQFTYDRGHPVVIRGAARTNTAVTHLVEGLRVSPHLETVTLGSMTESEVGKIPVVQFIIEGNLRGDARLEAPKRHSVARTTTRREPT